MANQELSGLKSLLQFLVESPNTTINTLTHTFELDRKIILRLLKELNQMGLEIFSNSEEIKLLSSIDLLDLHTLSKTLKLNQVNKILNYSFTTQSTNQIARDNKEQGVYIADYQYRGKGRREKKWVAPLAQSIALSISHDFNFSLQHLAGLNIAIGTAIINTAIHFSYKHLKLKWPNDVITEEGKVAGILIEATGNNKQCRAIIGIGINWSVHQKLLNSIEQDCTNIGIKGYSRTEFLTQLILEVEKIIEEFTLNRLTNIIHKWHSFDALKDKKIKILQGDQIKQATYFKVKTDGQLQIHIAGENKSIASGEVSIRKVD